MNDGNDLSIGVLCGGTTVPAWQSRCLEALAGTQGVGVKRYVLGSPAFENGSGDTGLWSLYRRLALTATGAFKPVDVGDFEVTPWDPDAPDLEALDALVLLIDEEVGAWSGLDLPHGCWVFRFGRSGRGGTPPPALIEEISFRPRALTATLNRIDASGHEVVLQEGAFRTAGLSVRGVLDAVYLGSSDWPAAVARNIRKGLRSEPKPAVAQEDRAERVAALPTLGRAARSYMSWQLSERLVFGDAWNIGIADAPIAAFLTTGPRPPIRWLPERTSPLLMADPFGIQRDGKIHVLAEEWLVGRRASLCAFEVDADGSATEPRPVHGLPEIASYPYLLELDGDIYCIPETSRSRRVCLYKATTFPDEWVLVASLVEGLAAADPTVFRHEDRWWLLCTDTDRGRHGRLMGFHASDLQGPWQPHVRNPLKWDVRTSRPAGTPFVHEGRLYRPAQDCSSTYGGAVVLNRIEMLTPDGFDERVEARIDPDVDGFYPRGLHTLSAAGDMTLVDGKRRRFIWDAYRNDALSVIKRRLGTRVEGKS